MSILTITAVSEPPRTWKGEHGTFHIYDVEFTGDTESGRGQIKQKETTAPPTVGMKNDYELVRKGDFPPELKRVQQAGNGGGFRGKSPEESNRIARMAAQKAAIELLKMELATGLLKPEAVKASELLKPRIDYFYDDILAVKA